MSDAEQDYWDDRWAESEPAPILDRAPAPPAFVDLVDLFPSSGHALDLACGRGRSSVWIAQRGLTVLGVDISPRAIDLAHDHATAMAVDSRCLFLVADLDGGLPLGPPVQLIVSHFYWKPDLSQQLAARLATDGVLAICHASESDIGPGEWRVSAGDLERAFVDIDGLEVLDRRDRDGVARVVARRTRR